MLDERGNVMPCECDETRRCDECEEAAEAEMQRMFELYRAEKRAGLLRPQEEIDRDIEEAGRGHLLPPERRTMPTRRG